MDARPTFIELRTLGTLDARHRDGAALQSILAQPKRTALLAYLALARPHGMHQRDTLLALFWGERDTERARKALRQALYFLKASLGENALVTIGDSEVGISPDRVWCDAVEMERAMQEHRFEDALSLYAGELLPGFNIDDAPEFERWLDDERAWLRSRAAEAAWKLALEREAAGDVAETVRWARHAASLSPADETVTRRLMELFDRVGDRAAALRAFDEFAELLRREYDTEPSAETVALADSLRQRSVVPEEQTAVPGWRTDSPRESITTASTTAVNRLMPDTDETSRAHRGKQLYRPPVLMAAIAGLILAPWITARVTSNPTMVSTGELPEQPVLIIADVSGSSAAYLGTALKGALRSYLRQSSVIRLMDAATVNTALSRMRRDPDLGLDAATALEVAEREGAAAVIHIEVNSVGPAFIITASVMKPDGSELMTEHEEAADTASLLKEFGSLAVRLQRKIARSARDRREMRPLPRVTTPSLEALRLFDHGERLFVRDGVQARAFYHEAIRQDSLFAMAYRRLAASYANHGLWQPAEAATRKAFEFSERLPEPERSLVAMSYYDQVQHDWPAKKAALRSYAVRYPQDQRYAINMSDLLMREHAWEEAARIADSALAVHPRQHLLYNNLFYSYMAMPDTARAWSVVERARRNDLNNLAWNLAVHVGEGVRDYDLARAYLDSAIYLRAGHLRGFAQVEGRVAEAQTMLQQQLDVDTRAGNYDLAVVRSLQLAYLDLRLWHDTTRAIARVQSAVQQRGTSHESNPGQLLTLSADIHPTEGLIAFYGEAGAVEEARRVLADWQTSETYRTRNLGRAMLAYAEQRYAEAIAELEWLNRFNSLAECPDGWVYWLARVQEAAGLIDEAIESYTRGVDGMGCLPRDLLLPHALQRLAALHDARGEHAKAAEFYNRFIHLWRYADPELQPQVAAARRRLTQLALQN